MIFVRKSYIKFRKPVFMNSLINPQLWQAFNFALLDLMTRQISVNKELLWATLCDVTTLKLTKAHSNDHQSSYFSAGNLGRKSISSGLKFELSFSEYNMTWEANLKFKKEKKMG